MCDAVCDEMTTGESMRLNDRASAERVLLSLTQLAGWQYRHLVGYAFFERQPPIAARASISAIGQDAVAHTNLVYVARLLRASLRYRNPEPVHDIDEELRSWFADGRRRRCLYT